MSDPDLTPEQDDAVRALLAGARHTDPTPPDVVARLEAELASLVADRGVERGEDTRDEAEQRAPVVTLASRRRRRAASLVLAAAAVVVAGVGLGQVVSSSSDDAGNESAGSAADSPQDNASSAQESESYAAEPSPQLAPESDAKQGDSSMRSEQAAGLSSDSALKPQVRRLRGLTSYAASDVRLDSTCLLPVGADEVGSTVPVTFDGLPAALVFRVPVGATQLVDVFVCGEPGPRRSVTLRAP